MSHSNATRPHTAIFCFGILLSMLIIPLVIGILVWQLGGYVLWVIGGGIALFVGFSLLRDWQAQRRHDASVSRKS
jgi:cytochrome c oxidase assembly factor CtaG